MWQDAVLTVGGIIFTIALLPSIFSSDKPAFKTSIVTAIVLISYCLAYASLGLWFAFISISINTLLWFVLAYQKFTEKKKVPSQRQ